MDPQMLMTLGAAFAYTSGAYAFCWTVLQKLQKHIEWDLEQHRGIADLKRRVEALEKR